MLLDPDFPADTVARSLRMHEGIPQEELLTALAHSHPGGVHYSRIILVCIGLLRLLRRLLPVPHLPQNSEERGAPPRRPALSIHPAPVVEALDKKFLFGEVHLRVSPSSFLSVLRIQLRTSVTVFSLLLQGFPVGYRPALRMLRMISYCFAFLCFPHPYTCMHVSPLFLKILQLEEFIRNIRNETKNSLRE